MALPKANLEHPCFPQPRHPDVWLWRYIDLAKLIALLTSDQLQLVRVDLLPDKFEGFPGRRFAAAQREAYLRGILESDKKIDPKDAEREVDAMTRHIETIPRQVRRCAYVSCWCANDSESEAMWRMYGGAGASVAIVTPYARLRDSLEDPGLHIGCVSYFDYNRQVVPWGNTFAPLMCKRREFLHENEVRVVKIDVKGMVGGPEAANLPEVIAVDWPVAQHIQHIVISPYATRWQHNVIRTAVARLKPKLSDRVRDSDMGGEPE